MAGRDVDKVERFGDFIKRCGSSTGKLEVLRFLSRHPQAKFSFDAIAASTSVRRTHLMEEVSALVGEGVVVAEVGENDVTWYSLTSCRRKCCVEEAGAEPVFECR